MLCSSAHAQFNVALTDRLEYDQRLNDIWGWTAPDGAEYALVGLEDGLSIVSLADPGNLKEVYRAPGESTFWRDIKTHGHYAFVLAENVNEGLWILDLSPLPDSVGFERWRGPTGAPPLRSCHNLYVDEAGFAYLAGCNLNDGGLLIVDLYGGKNDATGAPQPELVGRGPSEYAHDVYVRNDLALSSELLAGQLTLYDVSDKSNPQRLGARPTPFSFTHNAWLSDDGHTAFTTDERVNAPVAAYDITDPADIRELDQFRPTQSLNRSVIPHNVLVKDDYLMIAHYVEGLVIADASRPHNLVEVGQFDTAPSPAEGFSGAWGVYPFFASGLVAVSDIENGLFVLRPRLERACWVEGRITDADTGRPLSGVEVDITAPRAKKERSNASGRYATGQAAAGAFAITFQKSGYQPLSRTVVMQQGVVNRLDASLKPIRQRDTLGQTVIRGKSQSFAEGPLDFRIYPNPSRNAFNLEYRAGGGFSNVEAILFNTLGQPLKSWSFPFSTSLQFGHALPPGVYLLKWRDGEQWLPGSIRLVKEK